MEEIRKLQEELQRAQQSGTLQRLSERNCVQLIMKLKEMNILEVLHTVDGKQYVTPEQLESEIQDEVVVHGGRISTMDLQEILNMDPAHIDNAIVNIMKFNNTFFSVHGELMTGPREYLNTVCEEIDETLQEAGLVAMADLSTRFNLPLSFLATVIEQRLGTYIHGVIDQTSVYTNAYVARQSRPLPPTATSLTAQTARIRGLFSAFTRQIAVSPLIKEHGFDERLFHSVVDKLLREGRLAGSLLGRGDKAVYVPDIVSRTQQQWITSFFAENNYIEFDMAKRFGIPDPKGYVQSYCKGVVLETCIVSQSLIDNVNAALEDTIASGTWVDATELLPSPLSTADVAQVLSHCAVLSKSGDAEIFLETCVCSRKCIDGCISLFDGVVQEAANTLPMTASAPTDETKGKKRADRGKAKGDSDAAPAPLRPDALEKKLRSHLGEEAPDGLVPALAEHIAKPLYQKFQELQRSVFVAGGESGERRKLRDTTAEKFRELFITTRLCERGVALFKDDTAVMQKSLLRGSGFELLSLVLQIQAGDHGIALPAFTVDTIAKAAKLLPEPLSLTVARLIELMTGKTLAPFLDALEDASGELDVLIRKTDKKREKQILHDNYQEQLAKLATEFDPATVLHRTVLLLFQKQTGTLLKAPGQCVPQIVGFLKGHVSDAEHALLLSCQQRVIKLLGDKKKAGEGEADDVRRRLEEDLEKLKAMVQQHTSEAAQ